MRKHTRNFGVPSAGTNPKKFKGFSKKHPGLQGTRRAVVKHPCEFYLNEAIRARKFSLADRIARFGKYMAAHLSKPDLYRWLIGA